MSIGVRAAPASHPADSTVRISDPSSEDAVLRDLLKRCAQNDEAALSRFYELTSQRIYAIVCRQVSSRAAADAIMVTIYAKVWRRAARFTGLKRSALAWTTSIAFEASSS
jgi:RNA polymerase sigma-70 factor (ECF subfamily)